MRSMRISVLAAALGAGLAAVPLAAWAQSTPPAPPASQAQDDAKGRVEQRIADMHATLHITPAQEAQWDAFAQVMLDNAQAMQAQVDQNAQAMPMQNAVQIMQSYDTLAQLHAQHVQKLTDAFASIYAGLSPEQKQAADGMFRDHAEERQSQPKQGG